ncbi:MAG: ABC transporter permease [Alkalinema sp. RU_4_3]|nr:ABC transporter permease [Alkalinema sp. RU_4_3]
MLEQFLAELKRAWIQFRRYPGEAIGGIFIITSVFYGLFLSAKYIAGPGLNFGDRLDAVIVGYGLWTLVTFVLFDIAGNLQSEAQTGTLEQLFLSPWRASRVFLLRAIANLFVQMLLLSCIVTLIMTLTGRFLSFPITLILPLFAVLLGAYGLSFAMGALSLLLKRVQQIIAIVQFTLLFLLTAPTEEWTGVGRIVGFLLPMSGGAGVLRDLMARGGDLDWGRLGLALLNGVVYFSLGLGLFGWAERYAKRWGKLSGY